MAQSLLLFLVCALFMMLLLQRVNSSSQEDIVNFSFVEFTEESNLILQGDATHSSHKTLQLTKVIDDVSIGGSVGRALYPDPLRLYDRDGGRVAAIYTIFDFNVSSSSSPAADGLTFFFASVDTTIPDHSYGKFLGLFEGENPINISRKQLRAPFTMSSDQVVAVEFDTFQNSNIGDPFYSHIGIDVKSIRSKAHTKWDWQNGQQMTVEVLYDPYAKELTAYASYPDACINAVTLEVDLTTVLPEWVRVGFSASTGVYSQFNDVINWGYISALVDPTGHFNPRALKVAV